MESWILKSYRISLEYDVDELFQRSEGFLVDVVDAVGREQKVTEAGQTSERRLGELGQTVASKVEAGEVLETDEDVVDVLQTVPRQIEMDEGLGSGEGRLAKNREVVEVKVEDLKRHHRLEGAVRDCLDVVLAQLQVDQS